MTLKDLLSGQPAITQYELMARADGHSLHNVQLSRGRFYGGPLTEEQVAALTDGLKLKE